MIEICSTPIDHAAITERVRSHQAGAVCTFLGTVREMTSERRTVSLDYEAYPEMALKKLAEIERLPLLLSQSLAVWSSKRPNLKVRSTLGIVEDGYTVAIHVWFDHLDDLGRPHST